jgi:hypothetical protein
MSSFDGTGGSTLVSKTVLVRRELFGGAITLEVPEGWLDTEAFMDIIKRPVPDNQEIFVAPRGGEEDKPLSIFIDVLEAATEACPLMTHAPWFHAGECLRRDERSAEADALPPPPNHPAACTADATTVTPTPTSNNGSDGGSRDHGLRSASSGPDGAEASSQAAASCVPLSPELLAGGGAGITAAVAEFASCSLEVGVLRIPHHTTDIVFSLYGRLGPPPPSTPSVDAEEDGACGAEPPPPLAGCPSLREIIPSLAVVDWGLFGDGGDDDEDRILGS